MIKKKGIFDLEKNKDKYLMTNTNALILKAFLIHQKRNNNNQNKN